MFPKALQSRDYYLHFRDEEIGAQRGKAPHSESHSWQDLSRGHPLPKPVCFSLHHTASPRWPRPISDQRTQWPHAQTVEPGRQMTRTGSTQGGQASFACPLNTHDFMAVRRNLQVQSSETRRKGGMGEEYTLQLPKGRQVGTVVWVMPCQ